MRGHLYQRVEVNQEEEILKREIMNILLTDEDFKNLVRGKIIEKEGVKIALQDIGFDRMGKHVVEAIADRTR